MNRLLPTVWFAACLFLSGFTPMESPEAPTGAKEYKVEVFVYSENALSKRALRAPLEEARDRFLAAFACSVVPDEKFGDLKYNSFTSAEVSSFEQNRYGGVFLAACARDPAEARGASHFPFNPLRSGGEFNHIQAYEALNQEAFDFQCYDAEDKSITLGKFEE
jgi:hypothetical protein